MPRVEVNEKMRAKAVKDVADMLEYQMERKGPLSFVSSHEILGVIEEERKELVEAIQRTNKQSYIKSRKEIIRELKDIAVAAIFGIANIEMENMDLALRRQKE